MMTCQWKMPWPAGSQSQRWHWYVVVRCQDARKDGWFIYFGLKSWDSSGRGRSLFLSWSVFNLPCPSGRLSAIIWDPVRECSCCKVCPCPCSANFSSGSLPLLVQDSRLLFFLLGVFFSLPCLFPFLLCSCHAWASFIEHITVMWTKQSSSNVYTWLYLFNLYSCLYSDRRTTKSHHKAFYQPSTTKQLQLMPTTSQHTSHSPHVTRPAFTVHTYWETVRRIAWYFETSCVTQNLWRM